MYRLLPITMTDTRLVASSLAEDDHPAWSAATSYTAGQRVIRTETHRIYEALANVGPSATPPESDPANWLDVCATNVWQPFDYYLADQAVGADVSYTIEPGGAADTLVAFNTICESIDVHVERAGETLMDATVAMQAFTTSVDFFTWIMAVPEATSDRAIPIVYIPGSTITLTFNGDFVAIGQIAIGMAEHWGAATWDTSLEFRDFSKVIVDDFGNRKFVQRNATYDISFHVVIPPGQVAAIKEKVRRARGKPAVYMATRDAIYGSLVLGIMTKMSLDYSNPGLSNYRLQTEGLI